MGHHPGHEQLVGYLNIIELVMSAAELSDYMNVSAATTSRWLTHTNLPGGRKNKDRLGRLAATISFLETELSYDKDAVKNHLKTITIDPDTYQTTTMLEQVREGNSSSIIQAAIEASIT